MRPDADPRSRQADDALFFTTGMAAAALGVTREGVRYLVREALLEPAECVSRNGLMIFYRRDVEALVAARAMGRAARWTLGTVPRPKMLRVGLTRPRPAAAKGERSTTGGGRSLHLASANRRSTDR